MDFSTLTDDQLLQLLRAACAEAGYRGTAVSAAAHEIVIDAVDAAKIAREALGKFDTATIMAEKIRIAKQAVANTAPATVVVDSDTQSRIAQSAIERAARDAQLKAECEAAKLADQKLKQEQEKAASLKQQETQRKLWGRKRDLALAVIAGLPGIDDKPIRIAIWKNQTTNERRVYIQGGKDTSTRYGQSHEIDICYYVDGCSNHAPGSITGTKNYDKAALLSACKKCITDWASLKMDVRECAEYQETVNA